jgi:hypothetical protein
LTFLSRSIFDCSSYSLFLSLTPSLICKFFPEYQLCREASDAVSSLSLSLSLFSSSTLALLQPVRVSVQNLPWQRDAAAANPAAAAAAFVVEEASQGRKREEEERRILIER